MTEKLTASQEFEAIEDMGTLLPIGTRIIPREEVSYLLKKHYGFFLPRNCYICIPSEGKEYGSLHLNISHSKLGKIRLNAMINSPYFTHLNIGTWNEDEEHYDVTFVFKIKACFKKQYNALRGQYELG